MHKNYPVLVNQMQTFEIEYESLGQQSCALISYTLKGKILYSFTIGTDELTCSNYYPNVYFSSVYNTIFKNGVNVLTFQMNMIAIGYVTVNSNFVDKFSSSTLLITSLNVVRTLVECGDPILDIEKRSPLFYEPTVYKRNELFSVVSSVSINCNTSLGNMKNWRIFRINKITGLKEYQISLNSYDNPTVNYGELVIHENSLDYGVYRIIFEVTMIYTEDQIFTNQVDTYVKIIPSGLIISSLSSSHLSGGGTVEITRGVNQPIEFDPYVNSYDLDAKVSTMSLKFKYYCQLIVNGVQGGYPEIYLNEKKDLYYYKINQLAMMRNISCFDSPGNNLMATNFLLGVPV